MRLREAVVTTLFLSLLFAFSATAEETRHRQFSPEEIDAMKRTTALIQTRFGDITVKFYPEVAPNHVDNFIQLAESGFYNGTTFHRVIPGFMVQGGDPNSKNPDRTIHGTGGPGYRLKAEFNQKPHTRGVLSMARSGHPDSAGSQFFICVADVPHLNGQYTAFGEVTDGMAVVDQIVVQKRDPRDNPVERIEMTVAIQRADENKAAEQTPAP